MVADRVSATVTPATSIQNQPFSLPTMPDANCKPTTTTARRAAKASRLELPTTPWIGPPSNNQLRDHSSIRGSSPSGYSTQNGSTGWRITAETSNSNTIDSPRISRNANPRAFRSSSQLNATAVATPAVTVIQLVSTPSADD